jgi:hypothetical protein
MLHFTHTQPSGIMWPMKNCVSIAKMWVEQSQGTAEIVRHTVLQEMRVLFKQVSGGRHDGRSC